MEETYIENIKEEKNVNHVNNTPLQLKDVCRDFMKNKCKRSNCRYVHDKNICFHFWKKGECKYQEKCNKKHTLDDLINTSNDKGKGNKRRPKNTETFKPLDHPVDMRMLVLHNDQIDNYTIRSRDVIVIPNMFNDFPRHKLYFDLVNEIENCGVQIDKLMKPWHGDTHLIADDHTMWKKNAPVFTMVLDRIAKYFNMRIEATRFNWYKDASHWKPFHHDAAALKEKQALTQNITVAVSFGDTRDAAFEHVDTKLVVSCPQPDGYVYAFAKDTNIIWKHGILKKTQDNTNIGRISIIAWGFSHQETLY